MTKDEAWKLAEHWIAAWNAHDLESIMTHYEGDFAVSPDWYRPNALVLTEPINSETVVSKVEWAAVDKNAPKPSDSPEKTLVLYRRRVFTKA